MIFLGIQVDTIKLTLTIPPEKWEEIIQLVSRWMHKKVASIREVQQLAGSLNFACRCVKSGRVYLSRILNFLRLFGSLNKTTLPVTDCVRADIKWWVELVSFHNGISLMTEVE